MNKIQDFIILTNFSYCCNLPFETPGVIETFSFYGKIENFKIGKKGVPLYFYLLDIFCFILVLLVMPIAITIFNTINIYKIAKNSFIPFLFVINNSINLFY